MLNFTNLPLGETGRKAPGPKIKKGGAIASKSKKVAPKFKYMPPLGPTRRNSPRLKIKKVGCICPEI